MIREKVEGKLETRSRGKQMNMLPNVLLER